MSDIYLSLTETPTVVTLSQPVISSSVAATVTVGNTVTVALDANSLSALENVTVTVGAAVTVGNSVTIGSLPAISGTVTANAWGVDIINATPQPIPLSDSGEAVVVDVRGGFGQASVPISGTVTANVVNSVTVGSIVGPIGGSVFKGNSASADAIRILPYFSQNGAANYNEISTSNAFPVSQQGPISGTVTVGAMPSGALTTRFGSVTTANTAQITSAVTNTYRKYLLAQNISAGTVTIGIGFSPTTTQGIQLPAGGGLTFDAFCPTGAVYWLGAVTGAAFTILEG